MHIKHDLKKASKGMVCEASGIPENNGWKKEMGQVTEGASLDSGVWKKSNTAQISNSPKRVKQWVGPKVNRGTR